MTQHSGKVCVPLSKEAKCNAHACPIDCVVSAFSSWSACTKSRGAGYQTRTRSIAETTAFGGDKQCPALLRTKGCHAVEWPVDCVVSPFGAWGACSSTCSSGAQERVRSINKVAVYGGKM
jgi:hypothetical protein